MKPKRFVHMADLHLDMPFSSLKQMGESADQRRFEQRQVLREVVRIVNEKKADILLISGDLFEHEYVSKGSIVFINECFASIPHVKVFISPGNHDPVVGNSYYSLCEWSPNVHIFKKEIDYVNIEELGVRICGMGFDRFQIFDSPLEKLRFDRDTDTANILVVHGVLDSLGGEPGYNTIPTSVLQNMSTDYIALGHIHKYIPGLLGGKAFYPGSTVALGFDEPGAHGVIFGCIEGETLKTEFIPIDKKKFLTIQVDVEECTSAEEIFKKVDKCLKNNSDKDSYIKIVLHGAVSGEIIDEIDYIRREIKSRINNMNALLEMKLYPSFDLDDLAKGRDLRGTFAKKIRKMIEEQTNEEEIERLHKILYIGLSALDGKKVKRI